jgi:putative ABC transport system substrate-binding protein
MDTHIGLTRRGLLRRAAGTAAIAEVAWLAAACGVAAPFAQKRTPHIGYLTFGPREVRADRIEAFLLGLRELGYVEGQTISIEWRFSSDGSGAELPALVADLVRLGVDLIVTEGGGTKESTGATTTIPILAINATLPVESGYVASLARPGGNVTAVASSAQGIATKRLELMRELVPDLLSAIMLVDPTQPSNVAGWQELRDSAEAVSVRAARVDLMSSMDLENLFETPAVRDAQAIFNAASAFLLPVRARFAELALQHRLPAADINRLYAEAGLLLTYGPRGGPTTQSHRAAVYVDKILKGARPADLPVDQPTSFDLVINSRTAEALGIAIPASVAAHVTEWVE